MQTFIQHQMGSAFDPEKICECTGLSIWPFPDEGLTGMFYWREDGCLVRRRDLRDVELAWIATHPNQWKKDLAGFEKWRDSNK